MTQHNQSSRLRHDLFAAIGERDLWLFLAVQDIRLRYRRSKIGPFWITLTMAIFCLSLGVIYSQLFKADIKEYLPFLSIGFIFWGLISGLLGVCPNLYVEHAAYIKDIKTNLFTVLFRVVTQHLITFAHNILILIFIYLYFSINPGFTALIAIPGFVLVLLNLMAAGFSLSIIGARFRDVALITQNLIQVLFFITPIVWLPRLIPEGSWVALVNPFAYYLDLTRSPLLGHAPAPESWLVALGTLVILTFIAAWLYRTKASRIPFWV
jgi:ABC-type polysaccharide/polyol phosphate export permease